MDGHIRELERQAATGDPRAASLLERARERIAPRLGGMEIIIDGETYEINSVYELGWNNGHCISCGRLEFHVFENAEEAGKAARAYWENMAQNDPSEFRCIVGDEALIAWALGQPATTGCSVTSSLNEWLDLWLNTPEEQWGSYDNTELDVERTGADLREELGFTPTVAYRHN